MSFAQVRTTVFSWDSRRRSILLRVVFVILIVGLTLVPIINMTKLLATTGAENLGNDYRHIIRPLDRMLSGEYNWANYFRHSFFAGAHSMAIPVGIFVVTGHFGIFGEYLMIYIGITITFLRLLLLHDLLSSWTTHWLKWILLPILSFLVFANSQVSIFGFGMAGPQILTSLFGFTLGLWGLKRFPGSWKGTWIGAVGGLIAAWSGGYGVIAWPFLLVGMWLFNFRNPRQYLLWLLVGVIAALPYISFRASHGGVQPNFFRFSFVFSILGLPFASLFQEAALRIAGFVGFVSAVPGLFFVWRVRSTHLRRVFPALILLGYSFVVIYQITILRETPAPWYASIALSFWIAIVGIVFALCVPDAAGTPLRLSIPTAAWAVGFLGVLGYLFFSTNIDYFDKAAYLWVRRPVSASCMLYYRTAPTYCEGYIYQWGLGRPEWMITLAEPLERHHLSTFGAHQVWTLQGDFGLSNVQIRETPNIPGIFWTVDDGTKLRVARFDDFRHLNLFLHTPNKISWTVNVPSNVEQAAFHSAVAISESVTSTEGADGVTFEVSVLLTDGTRQVAFTKTLEPTHTTWEPFTIPLQNYAGQTITLQLASTAVGNVAYDWAMYRYPYIELSLDTAQIDTNAPLNLEQLLPSPTENDLQLDPRQWETVNIQRLDDANTWVVDTEQGLAYQTLDACLSDYTYIYIRIRVMAEERRPRVGDLAFVLDRPEGWTEDTLTEALVEANDVVIQIPFYRDSQVHDYYYPIRLLGFDELAVLRGIRLAPVVTERTEITVEDFRLIRDGTTSSRCGVEGIP